MKKKLILVALLFIACGFMAAPQRAFADISDPENYTITIPEAVSVTLASADTSFNSIVSSDFGQGANIQANNAILVGDGVVATSTSYITTNDTTNTAAKEFRLTVSTAGDTIQFQDPAANGNRQLLRCTDSDGAGASVDIIFRTDAGADTVKPTLGITTPRSFAYVSNSQINVPAASNVIFDGATKKAPLDLEMDLDESTLSLTADPPGSMAFTLTFTVVGVN